MDSISVTFLGTAAGRPCASRNVSSLVVRLDAKLWMVDCGEGTQHQLIDYRAKHLAMSKISRVFITHMHGGSRRGWLFDSNFTRLLIRGDSLEQPTTSTACLGCWRPSALEMAFHRRVQEVRNPQNRSVSFALNKPRPAA